MLSWMYIFHVKYRYSCQILIKFEYYGQIILEILKYFD